MICRIKQFYALLLGHMLCMLKVNCKKFVDIVIIITINLRYIMIAGLIAGLSYLSLIPMYECLSGIFSNFKLGKEPTPLQ